MDLLTTIMICGMYYTNSVTNAMVQVGSKANPLTVTVVSAPAGANVSSANNSSSTSDSAIALVKNDFKTRQEAADFVRQQIAQGHQVDIGLMQIPSAWLPKIYAQGVQLEDLFFPCKNVAVGTDLLNQSEAYCSTLVDNVADREKCALSFYWTGTPKKGLSYAKQIISYAEKNPIEANPLQQKVKYSQLLDNSQYELPAPTFQKPSKQNAAAKQSDDASQDDGASDPAGALVNDNAVSNAATENNAAAANNTISGDVHDSDI